jgi:hypothetical protein
MHLAHGGYDRVRQMFTSVFGAIPIDVASDLQDSVSLAWRLDLYGHPDPARWRASAPPLVGGSSCRCCSSTTSTWAWRSRRREIGRPPRLTSIA